MPKEKLDISIFDNNSMIDNPDLPHRVILRGKIWRYVGEGHPNRWEVEGKADEEDYEKLPEVESVFKPRQKKKTVEEKTQKPKNPKQEKSNGKRGDPSKRGTGKNRCIAKRGTGKVEKPDTTHNGRGSGGAKDAEKKRPTAKCGRATVSKSIGIKGFRERYFGNT